jgi:glutathione S-transferase
MAVKLHRCGTLWLKGPHPCWQVQKALDESGVQYEIVQHPSNPFRRSKRTALQRLSGQNKLPVIELEDGTVIRKESKELAAEIRDGRLLSGRATTM